MLTNPNLLGGWGLASGQTLLRDYSRVEMLRFFTLISLFFGIIWLKYTFQIETPLSCVMLK
jgi:hypothetical protein